MKDLVSGLGSLALGCWIWIYSASFPTLEEGYPGPSLFPRVIAAGLVLSGIGLAVGALRTRRPKRRQATSPEPTPAQPEGPYTGWLRLGGGLFVVAAYPGIVPFVGTIAALAVVCAACGLLLGVRARAALPTAVLSAAVIYFVFNLLLGVPL